MDRISNPQRVAVTFSLLFTAALGIWASPAAAQNTGDRFRVLVPTFLNTADKSDKFGKKTAEEVRKILDKMPRHRSVEKDELKNPLKEVGLKEDDLTNCLTATQLAFRMTVELVMCGEYVDHPDDDGARVKAQIIASDHSNSFEVAEFDAASPQEAATRIANEFSQFVEQITLAAFCNDEMVSQNWEQAIDLCDRALAINPDHFGSVYNKASAQWKLGQTQEAYEGFKKALELKSTDDNTMKSLGLLAIDLGYPEEANRYFKEFLILNPNDMAVRLRLAVEAANAGDPELGLQMIEEGMDPAAPDSTGLKYAGNMAMNAAALKMNEGVAGGESAAAARPFFEKALGYFEKLFEMQGSAIDPTILPNMLRAYTQLDRDADALAFGGRAVEAAPDNGALLSSYGDALQKAGRTDEAIGMLQRAAQVDPSIKIHGRIAQWELARGNIPAGIESLKVAIAGDELTEQQTDALSQQVSATVYNTIAKAKRYDEALAFYKQARTLSQSPASQGMLDFFEGLAYFEPADNAMRDSGLNAAKARAQLPKLQQAKELMTSSSRWTNSDAKRTGDRQTVLDALNQWINLANALIKRGGG